MTSRAAWRTSARKFGGGFDQDRASMSLRTLSNAAERDKALDIMAACCSGRCSPRRSWAREKTRVIAALKEAETAGKHCRQGFPQGGVRCAPLCAAGFRRGRQRGENHVSDLSSFYRTHYRAGGAVVAIMATSRARRPRRLRSSSPKNCRQRMRPPRCPKWRCTSRPASSVIAHPASQSHILIGAPGMARNDPDYFPLYVGNHIFGGGGFRVAPDE